MIARNVTINGTNFQYASVRFENDRLIAKGFNKHEEIVNLSLTIEDLISFNVETTVISTSFKAAVIADMAQHTADAEKSVMTETAPKKRGRPRKNPL